MNPANNLINVRELMKIHYGFSSFRLGQEQAISSVLNQEDTLVIMPTGGGKSLCYQLPALVLPGVAIVISPLIALMKDQVDQLLQRQIPATFINSSLSLAETQERLEAIKQGRYKLLYIAPERFYNQDFLNSLTDIRVSLFAIDEAHCISQWGHDFRPSYLRLKKAIELVGRPPIIALTATATPEIRTDIKKQLDLTKPQEIITGFARPNLQFGVAQANDAQKYQIIIQTIQSLPEPTGIVYAATRAKTDAILQLLIDNGIDAVGYHAGLGPTERQQVQNDFMSGRTDVIVATNAFGMGIDKANIRFVIHADLPGNIESYYQEAGRAGRDGQPSVCLLLYAPKDRYLREFFIKGDNPDPELILDIYEILTSYEQNKILVTYAEIKKRLVDEVPEMAVGTALKILESAGYVLRSKETMGQAFLQITEPALAQATINPKAKVQRAVLDKLLTNYINDLQAGWQINLEDLAEMLSCKKGSLQRLIKTLEENSAITYQPPFRGTEVHILKKVPKQKVELDFAKLKDKVAAAYDKLDKMENYIYHKNCRQKYLLDYFGDWETQACGKCDICLYGNYLQPKSTGNFSSPHQAFKKLDKTYQSFGQEMKVAPPVADSPLSTKLTQLQTFELYVKGLSVQDIATKRELTTSTIINHLCYLLEKNLPINIDNLVTMQKQAKIKKVYHQAKTDKLKELKELLGDDYSYDEIKLTLAKRK